MIEGRIIVRWTTTDKVSERDIASLFAFLKRHPDFVNRIQHVNTGVYLEQLDFNKSLLKIGIKFGTR